jgi:hypothetical protein
VPCPTAGGEQPPREELDIEHVRSILGLVGRQEVDEESLEPGSVETLCDDSTRGALSA